MSKRCFACDVDAILDECGDDSTIRQRLLSITGNAARVRETIKEITAATPGVIGAQSASTRRTDPILEGRRVLLADDEEMLRETVRDVLTGYGCAVSTASDGGAAIEMIAKETFDLVLTDIKMPVKNGYEVFAAAKKANPRTPVILTTGFGYDPNHSIIRARREGLAAVLFKPFKVDQLLSEIRTALKSVTK
jgi:CheY-like chemotaxis protein